MKTLFPLLFGLLLLAACDDIIVPDISEEKIILLAPSDQYESQLSSVTFVWEEMDDATSYNLEIVSPGFGSILRIELDTFITGSSYTTNLSQGNYEWSVSAHNDAYQSACCSVRQLRVGTDSLEELIQKTVILLSPEDNLFTNSSSLSFNWEDIELAENYVFQIGFESFDNLLVNERLDNNFTTQTLDTDGHYQWRVRAESEVSQSFTQWSTARFTLDRLAPATPLLVWPLDGEAIAPGNQNPDFEWSSASDADENHFRLYADLNQSTLLHEVFTTEDFLDLEDENIALSPGEYFWQLSSSDRSGNTSSLSELRSIIIQ